MRDSPAGRPPPGAELGYTLREASWGRGYATEAARACVAAAFGPLELEQLHAVADPATPRRSACSRSSGMRPDGIVSAYGRRTAASGCGARRFRAQ
jgi:RimJ/RimL family protein N-acetyltransferase